MSWFAASFARMNWSIGFFTPPCNAPAAGGVILRTGTKAHHFRSSSVIFPRRTVCFSPVASGIGAPSFTHFSNAAIWSDPSFLFFGGICKSASV